MAARSRFIVDFGDQEESEHNLHLTANAHQHAHPHSHYEHPGSAASRPPYSPFRHPGARRVPAIDPALHQSTGASRNVHTPMSAVPHHTQPNHLLQPDNAAHLSHGFYGDMRSSQTPPTSANASPRFAAISPTSQPRQLASHHEPSDRDPPSRDVADETIDHAYAAFILYCNPNFPTTTDTSELVKLFRMPPKSDGNAFSTWTLFDLIRRFDAKEIKTWTQLALDLGVKPPNTDEGQSTQKVQQYSVRLKRWMRAMHIDAFFEYLLGKQHPYFMQIPPPHDPYPVQGRDGVVLEEDLAIRALDPKFKPKRGRRKADEGDDDIDFDQGTPARKRPQLDTSIPFGNVLQPQSAYPTSAHPNNMHGAFLTQDPWTSVSAVTPSSALTAASAPSRLGHNNLTPYSASPMSGQQIRWRLNTENPQTPHPLSAVTPQSAYPFFEEPQSAVTPSSARSRSRRRHGPAVSSAWSTNSSSSTGKLRGRPPSNRSIRDGPYVTFPANPKTKEGPPIDRNPGNLTPIVERAHSDPPAPENSFRFPPTPASAISSSKMDGPLVGGMPQKQRLSLQVPPNVGNPVVRLVTPTVLVNGEENQSPGTGLGPSPISAASAPAHTYGQRNMYEKQVRPTHQTYHGALTPSEIPAQPCPLPPTRSQTESDVSIFSPIPSVPLDMLNRALAAELIRAPLSGRRKRLRGNEAKTLASAILQPLYAKPGPVPSSPAKVLSDHTLGIAISSCLGLTSAVGLGLGGPTGGVRRVDCIRFRVGGDGYESPIDEEDEVAETSNNVQGIGCIKETFDVLFAVSFGGLSGEWIAKDLQASNEPDADAESQDASSGPADVEGTRNETDNEQWKRKYLEAQRTIWEMKEEVKSLKDRVLEAVL
ncbi:ARS binding Abp2 [Pyrenophora seminiperda CCB06]|uniref:ARS binding Abp2 n=1 Tax=Pyrenophora seminiperda CCB06 TaxID=1302712 RepID=A0A3M7LYD2_9PLEO|nr:ARS binding Abp2 [Pyrenophora seminiperda CCB06]